MEGKVARSGCVVRYLSLIYEQPDMTLGTLNPELVPIGRALAGTSIRGLSSTVVSNRLQGVPGQRPADNVAAGPAITYRSS